MLGSFFDDLKVKLPQRPVSWILLSIGVIGLVGITLTIILVVISFNYSSSDTQLVYELPAASIIAENIKSVGCCLVEVSGAVNRPGVYKLDSGARIKNLLQKAGGFTEAVDSQYVMSSLNLVEEVKDGQKIVIPFKSSTPHGGDIGEQGTNTKTSVNTATEKQLIALPYIGEKKAETIIADRPYSSMEQFFTVNTFSSTQQTELLTLLSL